jgi:hypothetical protein
MTNKTKNTFPTTIRQRPPMSFAIANNLLAPNIKAIDLRISPWAITLITYNSFEKFENGSFGMKYFEKCSLTILDSPFEGKWEILAKT